MIRYSKLGYVALNVPNLARARGWYEQVCGLQYNGAGSTGELYFRTGTDHHSIALHEAQAPGLKRIGWELEDDTQLDVVARVLDSHGVKWRAMNDDECRAVHVRKGLRMREPITGATMDCYPKAMGQQEDPYIPAVVKMRHLGHVVLGTPHYREALDFYHKVLNFKTSDEIDGRISLMRCFPNPYHHSFGIAHADRNTLHHVNFMVSDEDDLARARVRFAANDVPVVWQGHHPPSGNTFLFFLDPDGLSLEYGYGMELFPEENPRPPRVFQPRPESFDSTGAERDARVASCGEIETAEAL